MSNAPIPPPDDAVCAYCRLPITDKVWWVMGSIYELHEQCGRYVGQQMGLKSNQECCLKCGGTKEDDTDPWCADCVGDDTKVDIMSLRGIAPNITGGMDSVEYVRRQRDR